MTAYKKIGRFFSFHDDEFFLATSSDGGFLKLDMHEEDPILLSENIYAEEILEIRTFFKKNREDILSSIATA